MKTLLVIFSLLAMACSGHQPTLAEANLKPRKALIVTGVIQKVQRNWTYEQRCGIIASIFGMCDNIQAFEAEVRDSSGHETPFMFFRFNDKANVHPMNGDRGTFVLHWNAVYPYLTCASRAGLTNACMADFTWQLESDGDMKE